MRTLVSLLILCSFLSTFGQKIIYQKYGSEALNDTREISIYLPKSYDKDSISNFPLAIILDGHKLFDLYVGTSNYYSYQDNAPEQIVVGINMKDTRTKDAGYDIITSELTPDSKKFYRFIRDELIPFMEATYKTSPFLTIVGESLTANFITHFLQEKYSIFNAYICLNPSLSDDINTQIDSYKLSDLSTEDNTFYFYLAKNPYASSKKIAKIKNFGNFIKSTEIANFNVVFDEFSNSPSSSSVTGEGISRAFAKVFEIYSGITVDEYNEKIKDLFKILNNFKEINYLINRYILKKKYSKTIF
jgi:hypothetical protein